MPVEWFYLYKLPQNHNEGNNGKKFAALASNIDLTATEWEFSDDDIDSVRSPLRQTLSQSLFVKPSSDTTVLMYNDQRNNHDINSSMHVEVEQTFGHMKGILAFDKSGRGFWLIHSIPHFPMFEKEYWRYPETARNFGQSIFCISLQNTNRVLDLFVFAHPQYLTKIPSNIDAGHKHSSGHVVITLISNKGKKLDAFAKSADEEVDVYSKIVSPFLGIDLLVETWRHGPDPGLPSDCAGSHHVMNVDNVSVAKDYSFRYTSDHSKWAVSAVEKKPVFCICDLNRQIVQMHRGGTCLCMESEDVHRALSQTIAKIEDCPSLSYSSSARCKILVYSLFTWVALLVTFIHL